MQEEGQKVEKGLQLDKKDMKTLKKKNIIETLNIGNRFYTQHLIVVYRRNNLGFPRFAFVISKKFSKKAVVRNRVKRIIKEALRHKKGKLSNLSYDIILIPKKGIFDKKSIDLMTDIEVILTKLEKDAKKNGN